MTAVTGNLIELIPVNGEQDAIRQSSISEDPAPEESDLTDFDCEEVLRVAAKAVRGGDLLTLKEHLGQLSGKQLEVLLTAQLKGDTVQLLYQPGERHRVRLPNVDRDVYIREPTLLVLGVTRLNPEVVSYLASFKVS